MSKNRNNRHCHENCDCGKEHSETVQAVKGEDVSINIEDNQTIPNQANEELMIQVGLEKQNAENFKRMAIQLQADFDNYRKRNQNLAQSSRNDGINEAVIALLPAYDALVVALKQVTDEKVKAGLEMVERAYVNALKTLDITPISTLGEPFDPAVHNAVMTEQADGVDSGTVLDELQRGFIGKNGVIRCATVKIAK